ncbi:MAG TPA: diguanylate cyclase, partial [Vicinamibacteria bacterium]
TYLLEARDGSIWVGTRNGAAQIQGEQVVAYTRANGLPHNSVSVLFEDPVSGMWVGTRGGLARIRGQRVTGLTSRQGLHEDAIVSAVASDDGALWLGGNLGLSRVSLREVEEVMEGRRARVVPLVLGPEDGMAHPEVNGGAPSTWKARGRLWFATRGGVVEVDPSRLAPNRVPPPVRIEQVKADGRILEGGGPWSLGPETRRLVFEFTAHSFRAPSRVRFRHRLEGFDAEWQEGAASRTAEYTNLSHGSYRFHVIAASEDGAWDEDGAAVELRVEPRFHERPWVRGLVGLLLGAVGPSFYVVRVRQLRRHQERLEQLVAARTAEIEAANARLAQLSIEDPLTGIANRRRLDEVLEEAWRRTARHRGALALLILDVDFFKAFNDHFGHPAGDAALRSVATKLAQSHRRAAELVARYGGEEFAVFLPEVSRDEAWRAAEATRSLIEGLGILHPGSTVSSVVTASVGVAWTEADARASPADLVEAADRALYLAKQGGRNRAESAEGRFAARDPVA